MKFAILAALVATTQAAGCTTTAKGDVNTTNAACVCNATCKTCFGKEAGQDTVPTDAASALACLTCATATPTFALTKAADATDLTGTCKAATTTGDTTTTTPAKGKAIVGASCDSTVADKGCADLAQCGWNVTAEEKADAAKAAKADSKCVLATTCAKVTAKVTITCASVAMQASVATVAAMIALM